ncbi:MAG: leucine-rich repeat domain-containing protein [Clostridia bacterium]|nr:leucine-rich repeat domain-containing protein [Clostridia bacterium]
MKSLKALILSLFILSLTALGVVGCIEPKTYEATPNEYFTFTELADGSYSVKAKDVTNLPEKLYIPEEYNGNSISQIDAKGFMSATIIELCLPSNVKVVGANAFNDCKNLSRIYFNKGLVEIGVGAFYGCTALEELNLPSSLVTIGERAFVSLAIRRLDLPEKVQTIGVSAFEYCTKLNSVYIGHNVREIGENAFNGISESAEFEISASNAYYRLDENGKPVKQ